MRTLYKYRIPIIDDPVVQMPKGAQLLKFAMQGTDLYVWALVDTEAEMEERKFKIFGTGHPVPDNVDLAWGIGGGYYNYRDSVFDRHFVWHIFSET
jgi:hypothetical protein